MKTITTTILNAIRNASTEDKAAIQSAIRYYEVQYPTSWKAVLSSMKWVGEFLQAVQEAVA